MITINGSEYVHCQKLVEEMARQQKSLQKLAAYRAGTLSMLDRHSGTLSTTGSMRSHGRGGLASSGHSALLATTAVEVETEGEAREERVRARDSAAASSGNEPLPAVTITSSTSSPTPPVATPPEAETNALPDVEDEGACQRVLCELSISRALRIVPDHPIDYEYRITSITSLIFTHI